MGSHFEDCITKSVGDTSGGQDEIGSRGIPRTSPTTAAADFSASDRVADHSRLDGPHVSTPAHLAAQHPDLPVYGRGAHLFDDILQAAGEANDPRASVLAALVVGGRAHELPLEPLYLRRPDAVPQGILKRA